MQYYSSSYVGTESCVFQQCLLFILWVLQLSCRFFGGLPGSLEELRFLFLVILGGRLFDFLSTWSLHILVPVRAHLTTYWISHIFLISLLCFWSSNEHPVIDLSVCISAVFKSYFVTAFCSCFSSIRHYKSDTCFAYLDFVSCAHVFVSPGHVSLVAFVPR